VDIDQSKSPNRAGRKSKYVDVAPRLSRRINQPRFTNLAPVQEEAYDGHGNQINAFDQDGNQVTKFRPSIV